MTSNDWLRQATAQLKAALVETARLDAVVLLCDELHTNSAQLLAKPELVLTIEQQNSLKKLLKRRATHEPLAYIRSKTEFFGREFLVNRHVLEPRPESETIIELLKTLPPQHRATVVDVGTGSGALAISAACEIEGATILATDIDPACLTVARQNADRHSAAVEFTETNLIEGLTLPSNTTLLVNLPYVPDKHPLNRAARHEPRRAIFGGVDGLVLYRELFRQIDQLASKPVHLLAESLPAQHASLAQLAQEHRYDLAKTEDFIQLFTRS